MSEKVNVPLTASPEAIRKFVKDITEISERIAESRQALNEVIKSNQDIIAIDDELKRLKEERKKIIETSEVITSYVGELEDLLSERKQIVADAKSDCVPELEINTSIKMLKKNIDPSITAEVYTQISDLIDPE